MSRYREIENKRTRRFRRRLGLPKWKYVRAVEVEGETIGPFYERFYGRIFNGAIVEVHPNGRTFMSNRLGGCSKKLEDRIINDVARVQPTLISKLRDSLS